MELTQTVLKAIEGSPSGIASLDVLESLNLASPSTLKTTLSRLSRRGKIIRLKRGVYSSNPIKDPYTCAQALFNGYLGFSTALHIHKLITEIPFTITVVTTSTSRTKLLGGREFLAVALKEKAIGFERMERYVVSTRAKTLFDCLYLPRYSVDEYKLTDAFKEAKLMDQEWVEFRNYASRFASGRAAKRMLRAEKAIRGDRFDRAEH